MKRPEIEEWDVNKDPVPNYNPSSEMITLGNRYKAVRDYALDLERKNAAYDKANKDFQELLVAANKERATLEARLKCKDCGRSNGHEEGCSGAVDWETAALSLKARIKQAEDAFESMILRAFAEGRDYQSTYKKGIPNTRISARLKALKDLGKEV